MREIFGEAWPEWPQQDHDLIRQPIDFLGINYYTRSVVRHDETAYPLKSRGRCGRSRPPTRETGWEVFPQGLTDTLLWVKQRYGDIPQYVTENGAAFYDPPAAPSAAASTTRCASTTTAPICAPCTPRSRKAWTSAATSRGR